jgi:hypothetical protein
MADITTPLQEARVTTVTDGDNRALLVKLLSTLPVSVVGSPAVTVAPTPIPDPVTLLASASRTSTTNSADVINTIYKGVLVWLNVTVVPGIQTITPAIQVKDPVSGGYATIVAPAAGIVGTGLYLLSAYPSAGNLLAGLTAFFSNTVYLPQTWRVSITHSGAGGFSYSVAYQFLP